MSFDPQNRWRRAEGDYPIGHALVCDRWQITAIPQADGTWIVRQPGTQQRHYDNLELINKEIDDMETNPETNPHGHSHSHERVENGAGLGGFLGSLGGVIVGGAIGALGAPVAVAVPISVLLSAGGGAAGARYAAETPAKKSATTWGGVGGVFGPLGAAIGGYFGGKEHEGSQENPSAAKVAIAATATVAVVGATVYGVHKWRKNKASKLPAPPTPIPVPNPRRLSHRPSRISLRA